MVNKGVINSSLEYIVDPVFSSIGFFHNGSYIVYNGDDKYACYKNEYNLVDGLFVDFYVDEDSYIFYLVKK